MLALDEMKRLRSEHMLKARMKAAEQRSELLRSASQSTFLENGRQRQESILRANTNKIEQQNRKQLAAEGAELGLDPSTSG